jgi:hypothetical protein
MYLAMNNSIGSSKLLKFLYSSSSEVNFKKKPRNKNEAEYHSNNLIFLGEERLRDLFQLNISQV